MYSEDDISDQINDDSGTNNTEKVQEVLVKFSHVREPKLKKEESKDKRKDEWTGGRLRPREKKLTHYQKSNAGKGIEKKGKKKIGREGLKKLVAVLREVGKEKADDEKMENSDNQGALSREDILNITT